jgi:hypothetical protein
LILKKNTVIARVRSARGNLVKRKLCFSARAISEALCGVLFKKIATSA